MRLKYLWTVLRHKWYVLIAGLRLKVPLWRLLIHDLSKFSLAEFGPYARRFQGDGAYTEAFARAWLHHQHKNPHHWEYWINASVEGWTAPLMMPEVFVREMIADWMAAGKVYGGKWHDLTNFTWFVENRHRMHMHPITWQTVYQVLDEVAKVQW